MDTDYRTYELSLNEKAKFITVGYICFFIIGYIFYKSLLISAIAGLLIISLIKKYRGYKAEKRRGYLLMQFKDLLYSLSASVSTGKSMAEGLKEGLDGLRLIYDEHTPLVTELESITKGIFENRGSEAELMSDFAARSGCQDIESFVDVYLSIRETGGDMEKVISKTADILTDKISIEKEIKAIISQKQVEAKIITAMPLVILAGLNITSSGYIDPLYETLAGRIIMTVSLAGMTFAYNLTGKITDIKV